MRDPATTRPALAIEPLRCSTDPKYYGYSEVWLVSRSRILCNSRAVMLAPKDGTALAIQLFQL
ncbi:hypothetical protein CCM_04118 [Cordyceps militaris CM01]|uniref:Uncharacterized protein n=1 Tax=Cordyceps militaris (strain CM01) TaxID=983644 RepID=G3JDS0_CORMM|nr:uncharacterized protein CCM_04118 [Cordyceps militaris CM01]EGX92745.1 hypothetical protein CCM_04118 [Cordyceps militaris CM01]